MKKYIVKPLKKGGYKAYELCADSYDLNSGEFLIEVEQTGGNYNNYTYNVEFLMDDDFVSINDWKFSKKIRVSTHMPGSYSQINSTFDVIDPNGLKLQLAFIDTENYIWSREGAIDFIFSKFWITALQSVEEYDNYKGCNSSSCWDDEDLLIELRAVAKLNGLLYNYSIEDYENAEVDVKCYIEKEYNTRLERLVKKADNDD